MEQINFRVWDKESQDFVYYTAEIGEEVFLDPTRHVGKLYLAIGFKDKEGDEVYAGDIVNEGANHPSVIEWCHHNEKIEGSGWCLHELDPKRQHIYYSTGAFTTIPGNWLVIGNVLKTPQLLTAWYRKLIAQNGYTEQRGKI
jgi:hypothetical protein